ncbi:MAG TPA: dihydrolipoamide acetyltransferase family protein [Candidatus Saccharimonadales bacterium]|nr:dihydrolipoamide acetyltransferase family protein [Candidatus Saccharimonadales bacterium]
MPEFKLPDLGEGVTEGEVVEWRVTEGATVSRDQILVVVGTDKATVEIPSPFAGRVGALLAAEGAKVRVGDPLLRVDTGAEPQPAEPARTPSAPEVRPSGETSLPQLDLGSRPRALPSVRRAARLRGLELGRLTGSGPQGRVRMADLLEIGRRVPLRGAARLMAERMTAAHQRVPQVTVVLELDVSVMERRVAEGAVGLGRPPTILGLISLATIAGLVADPLLNASLDDEAMEVVFHERVHLGIAVQTDDGLRVATIRDADRLSGDDFQSELDRVVAAARAGLLAPADLTGSTFTVSSGGKLGGLLATPIVNWPNLATLGVHAIQDRAVVVDGLVVPGRRANISLSFDHRVVDGMRASRFLYELEARLTGVAVPEAHPS